MEDNLKTEELNLLAAGLFFLEFYHLLAHISVLCRIRLLPRQDLVRQRFYFLFDTATVVMTNFVYTGHLRWLAALQVCQHLFFFFTWNEHPYTKKVISWSSLDWTYSRFAKEWHWDVILGTLFDTLVHAINSYLLSLYISQRATSIAMATAVGILGFLFFSSRLAWTSPSPNVPAWIRKRVQPVGIEKYNYIFNSASIGLFFTGLALISGYLYIVPI